ncbi:carotenoid oxygenase [Kalaharituber pfeilii]|nr:carotenoid oxygenase [Kalaharituber pfeilii]
MILARLSSNWLGSCRSLAKAKALTKSLSKRKHRSIFRSRTLSWDSNTEVSKKAISQAWPNAIGFKYHKDVTIPVQLKITGEFPDYVRGTLYRIGPGGHEVETEDGGVFQLDHWFDGLSHVHRFQIVDSKAIYYNSRHTCDSLIEDYRRQGSIGNHFSFGQGRDPCKSIFSKFMSVLKPQRPLTSNPEKNKSRVNISVTLSTDFPGLPSTTTDSGPDSIQSLYAKTDSSSFQAIHPETLEPVGLAQQRTLHPDLKGPMSAAHARTDPVTGDLYNFNLELGSQPTYRVFRVSNKTGKAAILATIQDAPGAYIHSFFLSKKYVILCVWNSHLAFKGMGMLWHENIIDAIAPYDPSKKARFYVVDRTEAMSGVVGVYELEAFFAFHTVNAWEEETSDGGEDVICEATAFRSLDIMKKFYIHNLLGNVTEAQEWLLKQEPRLTRWRLARVGEHALEHCGKQKAAAGWSCGMKVKKAEKVYMVKEEQNFELPTLNSDYVCRPHRYTYGLNTLGASTLLENIIKYDSQTRTHIMWSTQGHTPGEPIFVPDPASKYGAEDDGVLLSVVLDGHRRRSYLLCLDAKELREVARAELEGWCHWGFMGEGKGGDG